MHGVIPAFWFPALAAIVLLLFMIPYIQHAYAHFVGQTFTGERRSVDGFEIFFQPFPSSLKVNQSSTLSFSVHDAEGANILSIFSALTIKDRTSGEIAAQFPYKFYEFSDITIPYTFTKEGDFEIVLETRISGHEKYQTDPIVASFVASVVNTYQNLIPFDQLMLFYVTPAAAALAVIAVYLDIRGEKRKTPL